MYPGHDTQIKFLLHQSGEFYRFFFASKPGVQPSGGELYRRGGDGGGDVSSTSLLRGRFLNGAKGHPQSDLDPIDVSKGSSLEFSGFFTLLKFSNRTLSKILCLIRRQWFKCFCFNDVQVLFNS